MKLNHLDLLVRDVPATIAFLERYFGLQARTKRDSAAFAILEDGHGFVLVLQRSDAPQYPPNFHFGFLVDDAESVRELQRRARANGVDVSDVIVNARGTIAYFQASDGYRVEVSAQGR